ncbi:MAG: gluconate 2-dehydrogenase subunit 3 family protein [Bacteroidota bacterium]
MDRRKALKGLGLSLGYVIATPSVISILQSCKNETLISWVPQFFSKDESIILENLVGLILPKTENLPSSLDINIPQFIDAYLNEVASKEQQEFYTNGLSAIINSSGKSVNKLHENDYDALLAKYLKANKSEIAFLKKNEKDSSILNTLTGIRSMTIWAYKTSEKVGEEILAYDPIPGDFRGCISLDEATKGKVWSL